MELSQQVISLELAKRLKELGIKDNFTLFRYDEWEGIAHLRYFLEPSQISGEKAYAAFSVPELMEILPDRIDIKKDEPFNNFRFNLTRSLILDENLVPKKAFSINYQCDTSTISNESLLFPMKLMKHNIWNYNLSNALAKTLIYLI